MENNEEKKPNFPTFSDLEEMVQKESETEPKGEPETEPKGEEDVPPAGDPESGKEGKEEKKEKDLSQADLLKLATGTTEASEGEEIEITTEQAIENYNKAVAMGIFEVPDEEGFEYDGSEEATEKVHAHTLSVWEQRGKEQLFEKISDPYVKYLVEYGMEAGQFADLQGLKQDLKGHLDASKVDLSDVEQAKDIIRKHLTDLGNRPRAIDMVLNNVIENDELDEYGLEAKTYFMQKSEASILEKQKKGTQAAKAQRAAQKQYEQNFMSALQTRELAAQDRNAILDSFNNVELQNGNTIPEYQYKLEQIKQNPSDFIELLQILGKYETGKGFSNLGTATKAKTEKIKSIYEQLNGTSSTVVKSKANNGTTTKRKKFVPKFKDTSTII